MNSVSDVSSEPDEIYGSTTPRVWTPPLVELTPETSYGYDVIDFARDVLGMPLDPWQEWLAIHLGELLPDGRPRFRTALVVVARQNGKTHLARVLILFWLFVERLPLVLGTSTDRTYAKRAWREVIEVAQGNDWLKGELNARSVRLTLGEEAVKTTAGAEYTFAANNRRAGRSMTLHRWLCDELREHNSWDAWNAASKAQNAVPDAQTVCITNMGDDTSIVLDALRESATEFVETGIGDRRLGLFEWSAPPGADPTSLPALALANPNLGYRVDRDALVGDALRAKRSGGLELASFRTEVMCQRVHAMDAPIDGAAWSALGTSQPLDLSAHRGAVALCLDVSLDGSHATLAAAALIDGTVHVEIVKAWDGFGCTKNVRAELPGIVGQVRPRTIGWFPSGPAAALAADLTARPRSGWPPRRVTVQELRTDTAAVCMGLADLAGAGELSHPGDPMLDAHIGQTAKLPRGDGWVFTRRTAGPVDGAYAVAGAVHLARTLPPPPAPLVALSGAPAGPS
jgi:hypothetical protein